MVQLDEDLYPLIIDQLLSGDQSDLSIRTEQQQRLASLCRTSQTWNALCLPKLYKDCLVGDLDTFVQDIESNPRKIKHLNRITTLRLYHPFNNAYRAPCYLDIFAYGWLRCGMKTMPDDALAGFRWCKGQKEYGSPMGINVWLLDANQILEEAIQRYPRFLSKLEKVVMTGVGDYTYGDSHGLLTGKFGTSVIPNTLLELPSLEHYCQRAHGGPLALPNTIMRSRRVPKIVTFHPESMLTEYGKKWLPPIVLGTINRYMFNNGSFIGTRTDTGESLNLEYSSPIAPILQRIRALLLFREEVLVFDNPVSSAHLYI